MRGRTERFEGCDGGGGIGYMFFLGGRVTEDYVVAEEVCCVDGTGRTGSRVFVEI